MKAWVLHDIGDIRYEEREIPVPGDGEVLVRVRACGVCGSDIPRVYETGAHKMPLVIGHEFSGEVVSLGRIDSDKEGKVYEKEVSNRNEEVSSKETSNKEVGNRNKLVGKRVGVFPLIPCRECDPCRQHKYEMCYNYDYVGSRRDGAFAEHVSVPADNLIELPDDVPCEAAAMLEPMAVAVHAIRKGGLLSSFIDDDKFKEKNKIDCDNKINDNKIKVNNSINEKIKLKNEDVNITVCGLGTIGLLLTGLLLDAGYNNVYVIGNKDFQFTVAEKLGIDSAHMCDVRAKDPSKWLVEVCGGADVFFECVGKEECLRTGVDSAAPGGRIVTVGNPHSDMTLPRDIYWKILRRQLTISGSWNSSFIDDWSYAIERMRSGSFHPEELITHRLRLEELERGLLIMRDKSEEYIKVMVGI